MPTARHAGTDPEDDFRFLISDFGGGVSWKRRGNVMGEKGYT